ncbi:MAG: beta-galactosidase [Fimbriimonadaceae bacterium]|nr:beta-galactosidase [Fimbriimonadaceae bacterium]
MVELRDRRLLIDGKPTLVFAGEIHYFRLKRSEWEDRVRKLKLLGANAVATYVPWLVHEPREGEFDVTGRLRPENDLGAFIDLCHEQGLWFLPRPGPFIMAEVKNEGIPYWVYRNYPETVPITWDGEKARSKTLDYLAPSFLAAAERWYRAVMPLIAARLEPKGGPVIGVQLDNEIGMLSWVNNQPDLTETFLCDFSAWLAGRYDTDALKGRYPFDLYDPIPRAKAVRSPQESYAAALHRDLGDYQRVRFARYIAALRGFAEAQGVTGVPFIVNIHGTGGGRGRTYPIGIQQLAASYTQDEGYLPGSDHYLGELTRENAPDLYLEVNAFTAASARTGQPISSMEFEVGTGDYGETGAVRQSGASADFKVRLSLMQGNRLLNYYLLAGGTNPPLLDPVGDGNDRVAFTGQRHGFAAPISPEGWLDPTYHGLQATTLAMVAIADKLADMDEEHDPVAVGYLPDYYKTDYHRPGVMESIVRGVEWVREPMITTARAMLFNGFRFPAVDLQTGELDAKAHPALVVAAARYMDRSAQDRLARYVAEGGRLLLVGEFPYADMEARRCVVLADALGVRPKGFVAEAPYSYPSLRGTAWAVGQPEVRVWRCQTFEDHPGAFMRVVGTDDPTGIEIARGKGKAIVFAGNYPCHLRFFRTMLQRLDLVPGLRCDASYGGVVTTSVRNRAGERFVTVLNLDPVEKELALTEASKPLFDAEPIVMAARSARTIPLNVAFPNARVVYATTDILAVEVKELRFKGTGQAERIVLETAHKVTVENAEARKDGGLIRIRTKPHAGTVVVRFG